MVTILNQLNSIFRDAFTRSGVPDGAPVLIAEPSKPEFGDFQVNGVMAAAKILKMNPRELASQVVSHIALDDMIHSLEIAGPGFINVKISDAYLSAYLAKLSVANQFGALVENNVKETIVVDLSGPNLAKEMHVGHLRSTVIGDALARILTYLGHKVIRQNHVGDWGTQFGMLLTYLMDKDESNLTTELQDLEVFYRSAKQKFDADPDFAARSRAMVVELQASDIDAQQGGVIVNYWREFRRISLAHCNDIYQKLGVNLCDADVQGESSYNKKLSGVVTELEKHNLITESEGAKCVFFAADELPGGETTPFIIQKQDGGFLYATTDLASVDYRVHELGANRIVYVVDARQAFHFRQLFLVAKKAGFADASTRLEHSAFGTMMNENGSPFKTRDGGTVKLADLINEAVTRARALVVSRNPDWSIADQEVLAQNLAVSAIKYADLSKNRASDYIFNIDKMLSFEGNTAPYLLYAYTRIQSILKKSNMGITVNTPIMLTEIQEHKLALHLAKFADMLFVVADESYPHYLCQYLYGLSGMFMQFYESCPILKGAPEVCASRLFLCMQTAEVLRTGLDLLGIKVVDRM